MHIIRRRGWEIPESRVTPEPFVLNRRALLATAGAATILPAAARAEVPINPAFKDAGRPVTEEKYATTYNNYYEFDTDKTIWREAQNLKQHPWSIRIDGMVSQPRSIGVDELLAQTPQEERIYRHRCVEAWAMTVPWTGFPLSKLVKLADPLASAKYVVFQTTQDK